MTVLFLLVNPALAASTPGSCSGCSSTCPGPPGVPQPGTYCSQETVQQCDPVTGECQGVVYCNTWEWCCLQINPGDCGTGGGSSTTPDTCTTTCNPPGCVQGGPYPCDCTTSCTQVPGGGGGGGGVGGGGGGGTPPPSCNPNNWGQWSTCSGSLATRFRQNECGTEQIIPCTGTINARAVVVTAADTSCTTVRASTSGINGATHQFTAGSASQPAAQTQSGASYVTFGSVVGGTYTISPTVPASYVLANPCWSKSTGSSGAGLSQSLSVPTDGETLTWDLGYTLGTPWVQTSGGDVYAAGSITSYIADLASPRSFVLNGSGGYPGVVSYGTGYDFDVSGLAKGASLVSSTDWLVNQTHASINYYDYFRIKLGGTFPPAAFPDLLAVSKPASSPTPYYVVGDMTTSGDWSVADGETIIVIVNGNLTLGGNVTLTGSGFAAFIVNGNITVSSSVGGLYTSSTPVIEGIYVTSPTGTFKTGTSSVVGKERLVLQGMFIAGGFTLQRDLDSVNQNTTTSSELFLYNPRLLFSMPDSLRDVPIFWQEVAP